MERKMTPLHSCEFYAESDGHGPSFMYSLPVIPRKGEELIFWDPPSYSGTYKVTDISYFIQGGNTRIRIYMRKLQ